MDKATKWLVEQYENPAAAYSVAEWAQMAGMPSRRVYRWFVTKKLIMQAEGKKQRHHMVSRDAVQGTWADFWRSIRRRLADVVERANR